MGNTRPSNRPASIFVRFTVDYIKSRLLLQAVMALGWLARGLAMRGHARAEECLQQLASLLLQPEGDALLVAVLPWTRSTE